MIKKQKVEIIYLIAHILSKSKHRDFYTAFCDRLIPQITSFFGTNDALRRKLIVALGWVGALSEVETLTSEMLGSKDSLCRAWAAASLMQMSFYRVNQETLRAETKAAFLQGISSEKEPYACVVMIEAAQNLFDKKWISSSTVQNQDAEKMEKARKMAVRFLDKN